LYFIVFFRREVPGLIAVYRNEALRNARIAKKVRGPVSSANGSGVSTSSKTWQHPSPTTVVLFVAIGLYLLALALPALHMQSVNGLSDAHYTGLDCLAFGWSALGQSTAWLANMLFVTAILLSRRGCSVWALVAASAGIALSFTTLNFLGHTRAFFDPSNHNVQVGSVDVGFYFWLAAQAVVGVMVGVQIALKLRGEASPTAHATEHLKDVAPSDPVTQRSPAR
jgi:hypothetical protein